MRRFKIPVVLTVLLLNLSVWHPEALSAGQSRIVFSMPLGGRKSEIFAIDEDGHNLVNLTNHPASDTNGVWSPDGAHIAFASDREANVEFMFDIYVMDANGRNQARLTSAPEKDSSPSWSPDGKQIAFARGHSIYVMSADGSNQRQMIQWGGDPAWSPDGTTIAFSGKQGLGFEICVMDASGGNRVALTNGPNSFNHSPAWKPDGSEIVFVSENRNNPQGISIFEIYLMNADGSGQRKLTPNEGGLTETSPTWSPDGSQIAFRQPDGIYLIQPDGKRQRRIFSFPIQAGFGGLSWFDPSLTRSVHPSGKLPIVWGQIREAPSHL